MDFVDIKIDVIYTNIGAEEFIVIAEIIKGTVPRGEAHLEDPISSHKGIAWYRGYFKDDLIQEQVEEGLKQFNAKSIVVGHTLQSKVNKQYNGKVIGIDVKHPKDYSKSIPNKKSEGLLIENNQYHRVLHNGEKKEL